MGSIQIFMQVQNLSIILVSYQRPDLLEKSLRSLALASEAIKSLNQHFNIQTYLCINGNDDDSDQLLLRIQKQYSFLSIQIERINIPVSPAAARNHLLQFVKSEFVFFMDDDVCLPKDIFLHFLSLANQYPNVDVWGGPNLTPVDNSQEQKDCGWLVSQPLLVGPIAQRYAFANTDLAPGGQFNLMLCNLFVRHKLLGIGFESFFKTAEENELIYRLQSKKCQMLASHNLFVWHERRANAKSFVKQIFYYGYGRGQLLSRVSLLRQKFFLLVPFLFLFICTILFSFPKIVFAMILIWLCLIQFLYLAEFRRLNAKIFILPVLMCGAYVFGLFRGQTQMVSRHYKAKILRA